MTKLPAANTTVTIGFPMVEDSPIIKPNFSLNKFSRDFLENLKALFSNDLATTQIFDDNKQHNIFKKMSRIFAKGLEIIVAKFYENSLRI